MLHDLGKVSISDGILRKPSTLSDQEYDQVKRHTEVGAELVARVEGPEPIVPWVRHANERYDGTGYPDGLAGDAIPPAARQRCAGTRFDPASVTALEQVLTAKESMGDPPAATRSS